MTRAKHKLSKLDLLEYALEGAVTRRGVQCGSLEEDEEDTLDNAIEEIERRIKLVKIAAERKKP